MLLNRELFTYLLVLTVFSCDFLQFVECVWSWDANYHEGTISTTTSILPEVKNSTKWTKDSYPDPWKTPKTCGRIFPSFLCDVDKLLTREQRTEIDKILWEYPRNAICPCDECGIAKSGILVAVALMKDADVKSEQSEFSDGNNERKPTWKQLAEQFRKKWRLGPCENDIVVVISPLGGGISFGELSKTIVTNSWTTELTESDFPKSQSETYEFILKLIQEIHSVDLSLHSSWNNRKATTKLTTLESTTEAVEDVQWSESLKAQVKKPEADVKTWGVNSYIAAPEDDEFKMPENQTLSSSVTFMIVGSLIVILVSLIALALIIWYYRTKTGNIEPSTMNIKSTDEKTANDIRSVKYEPCKTEEPGLPV